MGYLQFCRKGGNRKKEVKWGQTMRVQKNIAHQPNGRGGSGKTSVKKKLLGRQKSFHMKD